MLMDNHKKGSRPSLHEKVTDAVKKMAQDSGCVVGKWMLIEPTYKMDEAWKKVKEGVRSNKLGFSAKMTDGPAGTRTPFWMRRMCGEYCSSSVEWRFFRRPGKLTS